MNLWTSYLIWIAATATTMVLTAGFYTLFKRREAKISAQKMTRALSKTHAMLTAIEHIPDPLINRDLRRGLVLLLSHHIDVLNKTNPDHAHLAAIRNRVAQINRIPTGLKTRKAAQQGGTSPCQQCVGRTVQAAQRCNNQGRAGAERRIPGGGQRQVYRATDCR